MAIKDRPYRAGGNLRLKGIVMFADNRNLVSYGAVAGRGT